MTRLFIPSGLVALLQDPFDHTEKSFSGVDKAATPAERVYSHDDLCRELDRLRPQTLVAQRDSDVNRAVAELISSFSFEAPPRRKARCSDMDNSRFTFEANDKLNNPGFRSQSARI